MLSAVRTGALLGDQRVEEPPFVWQAPCSGVCVEDDGTPRSRERAATWQPTADAGERLLLRPKLPSLELLRSEHGQPLESF